MRDKHWQLYSRYLMSERASENCVHHELEPSLTHHWRSVASDPRTTARRPSSRVSIRSSLIISIHAITHTIYERATENGKVETTTVLDREKDRVGCRGGSLI